MGLRFFILFALLQAFSFATPPEPGFFTIEVIANEYDYYSPWSPPIKKKRAGCGFLVKKNKILTNAHVVANASCIFLQKPGDLIWHEAIVTLVDHDADMALLSMKDPTCIENALPFSFATFCPNDEPISVYRFTSDRKKMQISQGVTLRSKCIPYAHSDMSFLATQIDALLPFGSSGAPVINGKNEVVGMVHQMEREKASASYMIPLPMIFHFLQESDKECYFGFPPKTVYVQHLKLPPIREYFKVPEDLTGVLVVFVTMDSCFAGILMPGDILLSVDGLTIDNQGMICTEGREKTSLATYLENKFVEEKLFVKILREGKELDLEVVCKWQKRADRKICQMEYDKPPSYFILQDFVFQPLTVNFLRLFGADWIHHGPKHFLYHYAYRWKKRNEVVFLSRILSEKMQSSYPEGRYAIVETVNGKKIESMKDLVKAFESSNGIFHVISMKNSFKIVLSRKECEDSRCRLFENYGIPLNRSVDLEILEDSFY